MKKGNGFWLPAVIVLLTFDLFLPCAHGQEAGTGVVYGDDHAFLIKAPGGWVLDNESGVIDGLHAVFYPVGSSWRDSSTIMYAQAWSKYATGERSEPSGALLAFMAADALKFKQENPGIVVSDGSPLRTKDGKTALLRIFSGDKWNNREAVAYIEEPTVVAVIVLSCRDNNSFDRSLPAFKQLVASYEFVTEKPNIEKLKEVTEDFDNRVQAGKQAELTKEGGAYGAAIGPFLADALHYCLPPSDPPYGGSFTLVANILPSGVATSVEIRPQDKVSRCLADYLRRKVLPAPPRTTNGFPVTFEVTVKP